MRLFGRRPMDVAPHATAGGPVERSNVDYEALATFLASLAYPARLELLDTLRLPRTLGEIRLEPRRAGAPGEPSTIMARQTVQRHLDKLAEQDLVRVDETERGERGAAKYIVNPARLYAMIEELRRVSTLYAGVPGSADATGTLGRPRKRSRGAGPRLVLAHGVYEGKSFLLESSVPDRGQWTIGRDGRADIVLDYDPFISVENAMITHRDGAYHLRDLASKNGTFVNWEPLDVGQEIELHPADIIGVGRSLLVFAPG